MASVERALIDEQRLVLAVSGGIDSMVLLDAVARLRRSDQRVIVATVDHGTGPHAIRAAALVAAEAMGRGFAVRTEHLRAGLRTEAAWREARWRFFRGIARAEQARVVTAHTRDDHVETVVMRILRGAGARGLAGLHAPSGVARPLLEHTRAEIVQYARTRHVPFLEDPTNRSRVFLRNRVRLDLLPAIRHVRPEFDAEVLAIASRAAHLRREVDGLATTFVISHEAAGRLEVTSDDLPTFEPAALRVLWPSLAGFAGVALDRRATARLATFTREAQVGDRMPIAGGFEVVRDARRFILRPVDEPPPVSRHGAAVMRLAPGLRFGPFRFETVRATATFRQPSEDPWQASLPRDVEIVVRAWAPGDRMEVGAAGAKRRVKRFFADAHIAGPLREGWPVVLVNGKIVWIPGVRCAPVVSAARSRTSIVYRCEPLSR